MFTNLPNELLNTIYRYVTLEDLGSLRRTCKLFKEIVSPILFNNIIIKLDYYNFEESIMTRTGHKKDYEALKTSGCFGFIKHLHLQPPLYQSLSVRCLHPESLQADGDSEGLSLLIRNLTPFLEQLKDNSLLSFSWDLGLCVPLEILGPLGYLPDRQSNIQTLSLITSTDCSGPGDDPEQLVWLAGFSKLRKFSWKCLRSPNDYQALRNLLHASFDTLEDFTVESGNSVSEDAAWSDGRNSIECVLVNKHNQPSLCFPTLRLLSVTEFSFAALDTMANSIIDFSQLHSLALQNCTDTSKLLHGILISAPHIALKHLELNFHDHIHQGWETSSLVRLLQSFEGLEDLYLMIDPCLPTESYWDSMATHHRTLKRFLYHERSTEPGLPYGHHERTYCDAALRWCNKVPAYPWLMHPGYVPGVNPATSAPLHSSLAATKLDCLALCDLPATLRVVLEPYVSPMTFKLLHVRRTAVEIPSNLLSLIPELIEFKTNEDNRDYFASFSREDEYMNYSGLFDLVNWAFGPRGLPRLQVLAFGDFTHDDGRNVLFCRQFLPSSKMTWRVAESDETAIFDGIDRPRDLLGACPLGRSYAEYAGPDG